MKNYAKKSLEGLWVGDCVGNLGQLYFCHDILKALESGMAKFGEKLDQFHKQFQYSDDTEEAIVIYNHLHHKELNSNIRTSINQDLLAVEFAKRLMERDPDGEIYGYGLMTRKVLRDIYEGVPWREANKTKPRIEGPSFVDKLVSNVAEGKPINTAMAEVNAELKQEMLKNPKIVIGSCGNGSAMRVAPLGAYLAEYEIDRPPFNIDTSPLMNYEKRLIAEAALQAQVTHCHPEGVAGSIAITSLSYDITYGMIFSDVNNVPYKSLHYPKDIYYNNLLRRVPQGEVWNGIRRARDIEFDRPLVDVIKILGNGTHVTCQDTVPLCCYLAIKALMNYSGEDMYEKAIIETSMAFGDVDTNCAIVGGLVGIVNSPPDKWRKFCQPMEDVCSVVEEQMMTAADHDIKEIMRVISDGESDEHKEIVNRFQKLANICEPICTTSESIPDTHKVPAYKFKKL